MFEKYTAQWSSSADEKGVIASKQDKASSVSVGHLEAVALSQVTHRKLSARQIQLLALAGTVGAALFVAIGQSLSAGGPLNLVLAVSLWVGVIFCVAHCQAELVGKFPLDGSFITLADRFVSEAYGVMTGYNFLVFQAALLCFEINIFNVVIGYWEQIFVYFVLNIWSAAWFGEAEFFLALGKLILIVGMLLFTFITMLGGNPQGDRYGFRFWKDPGVMNSNGDGALGRFEGFLACLINSAFLVAGPEYISMVAGEAQNPRRTMPKAFTSIIYRLTAFFILGSLAVSVIVPYTDPGLLKKGTTAAASPYVLGMNRMGITVLPDIVNALIASSIFSSGNAYVYGSSRSLYSLALKGQAPRIFTWTNRHGNPYMAVMAIILVSLLSYLSVSSGTAKVLNWWVSLVTAGQLMDWLIMATTWIRFNAGMKAQGLDRNTFLAYKSPFQPYAAWIALIGSTLVLGISGYTYLKPNGWKTDGFIFAYGMCFVDGVIYIIWALITRKWKWRKASDMDFVSDLAELSAYEREYEQMQANKKQHFGNRINKFLFD